MTAVGGPCFPGIYWFVDGEGWTHVCMGGGGGEGKNKVGKVLCCVCVLCGFDLELRKILCKMYK